MLLDARCVCRYSAHHAKKKQFVDDLRKAVNPQNNKLALMEGGVTACVKMCKAFTYVKSTESSSVLLTLVKSVVLDLKVRVDNYLIVHLLSSSSLKIFLSSFLFELGLFYLNRYS